MTVTSEVAIATSVSNSNDETLAQLRAVVPDARVAFARSSCRSTRYSRSVRLGGVGIGWHSNGGSEVTGTGVNILIAKFSLEGALRAADPARDVIEWRNSEADVVFPRERFRLCNRHSSVTVSVSVSQTELVERLAHFSHSGRLIPRREPSAMRLNPELSALNASVAMVIGQMCGMPSIASSPLVIKTYEDLLADQLILATHQNEADLKMTTGESQLVRLACEYLISRAPFPVSIHETAMALGVSRRTLEIGFMREIGLSPLQFLQRHRMELFRSRLIRPAVQASVTTVALECGVVPTGRLSARYRQIFGESPSETLSRTRRLR